MNMSFIYGQCYKCGDRNGPWILVENNKWYCEECHEKHIKKLLATNYIKDEQQHNDKA